MCFCDGTGPGLISASGLGAEFRCCSVVGGKRDVGAGVGHEVRCLKDVHLAGVVLQVWVGGGWLKQGCINMLSCSHILNSQ